MLKKMSLRKIGITSVALFATTLIYLIPSTKSELKPKVELEYVSNQIESPIFLIDKNNYVAMTKVVLTTNQIEEKAKEVLNILTIGNDSNKLPSGFKAIIPPDTRIKSLKYQNGLIKVDFSSDLLDVSEEQEEKLIEAIVYNLTEIDDVNKVIIYVEGEILTKLPKTKLNLPSTLDRSFGVNKNYEFTSTKDINRITVYYVNKEKNNYYYVPVTKYLNDNRDKISIVIDELTSGFNYQTNLMSFLNSDVSLVSNMIEDDTLKLEFNTALFDDVTSKEVLEEVIYTICLSAYDNYDIKKVILMVGNEEIYKTTSKTIESLKDL